MARYAEDLRLMMKVLPSTNKINFDEKVSILLCNLYYLIAESLQVNLGNINLYVMEDIGFYIGTSSVQSEIKRALRNAVNFLHEKYNMRINDEKFDEFKNIIESAVCLIADLDDKIEILKDPNHPDVSHLT